MQTCKLYFEKYRITNYKYQLKISTFKHEIYGPNYIIIEKPRHGLFDNVHAQIKYIVVIIINKM